MKRDNWKTISRRTMFKAGAVTIALPFLQEMLPKRASGDDSMPPRVITATLGGGLAKEWQEGDYFGGVLAPLAPFESKLGFYRGLRGRDNHGTANAYLMTGADWIKDVDRPRTATIDWKLMNHFYPDGFPGSIPFLSFGTRRRAGDGLINEARVWDDTPNPIGFPHFLPNEIFRAIFGRLPTQSAEDAMGEAAADASILDATLEQFRYYTSDAAGLSMASRARLSDHMDHIRSIEGAIGGLDLRGCEAPELPANVYLGEVSEEAPRGERSDVGHFIRQFNVMADLFVFAMRCDLTRFGHALIFPLAAHGIFQGSYRSFDGRVVDFDRLRELVADMNRHGDWHNTNHLLPRRTGEERERAMLLAEAYRQVGVDMLGYLLGSLDAPESVEANGRTILENSVFFAVSELGTDHDGDSVFHALGSAGGTFRTGLIDVPEGATPRHLYETVLEAHGAPPVDVRVAHGDFGTLSGVCV